MKGVGMIVVIVGSMTTALFPTGHRKGFVYVYESPRRSDDACWRKLSCRPSTPNVGVGR